jgi:hypothetical protein
MPKGLYITLIDESGPYLGAGSVVNSMGRLTL